MSTNKKGSPPPQKENWNTADGLISIFLISILEGALNQEVYTSKIPHFQVNPDEVCEQIYLLPFSIVLLAEQYRNKSISKKEVKALFPLLEKQLLEILDQRFDDATGLPYLLTPAESILPNASYWKLQKEEALFEPAFIALMVAALEALIYIGGKLRQDNNLLIETIELLVFSANDLLWSKEYGCYFPLTRSGSEQIVNNSIGGLLPIVTDIPDLEQAEAILRTFQLNFTNPAHFLVPLECIEDESIDLQIDLKINWLLLSGFIRFEFENSAYAVQSDSKDLIELHHYRNLYYSQKNKRKGRKTKGKHPLALVMYDAIRKINLLHHTNH